MWYSVRLLFESKIDAAVDDQVLCEQSICVVQATSETEAFDKAEKIGHSKSHSYKNEDGENVRWIFRGIQEVQDLCEEVIVDGTEVFSLLFYKGQAAVLENEKSR